MIRCVDTFSEIPTIYPNGVFDLARWRAYAQNHFGENISLFEDDMNECLATGSYTFERDYLPVLQAVWQHPWLEEMHQSFLAVVKGLSERLAQKFGNDLDVDLFLYVGLCNGAGWVTTLNSRDVVLLGIEKILGQHRTIAEASAVESPIRQETIGFPAHFFARAHNFKPPGRACQPEADSPMRT